LAESLIDEYEQDPVEQQRWSLVGLRIGDPPPTSSNVVEVESKVEDAVFITESSSTTLFAPRPTRQRRRCYYMARRTVPQIVVEDELPPIPDDDDSDLDERESTENNWISPPWPP
jgi:hypothetical protein